MSTTKLHDYIYNIEMAQIESELDVMKQMSNAYCKAANILEYYNGNDLSSFKIFNDDYSSDNIIQEGKIMDDVKKQGEGKSTLNKIFWFIPRLIMSLIKALKGQLKDDKQTEVQNQVKQNEEISSKLSKEQKILALKLAGIPILVGGTIYAGSKAIKVSPDALKNIKIMKKDKKNDSIIDKEDVENINNIVNDEDKSNGNKGVKQPQEKYQSSFYISDEIKKQLTDENKNILNKTNIIMYDGNKGVYLTTFNIRYINESITEFNDVINNMITKMEGIIKDPNNFEISAFNILNVTELNGKDALRYIKNYSDHNTLEWFPIDNEYFDASKNYTNNLFTSTKSKSEIFNNNKTNIEKQINELEKTIKSFNTTLDKFLKINVPESSNKNILSKIFNNMTAVQNDMSKFIKNLNEINNKLKNIAEILSIEKDRMIYVSTEAKLTISNDYLKSKSKKLDKENKIKQFKIHLDDEVKNEKSVDELLLKKYIAIDTFTDKQITKDNYNEYENYSVYATYRKFIEYISNIIDYDDIVKKYKKDINNLYDKIYNNYIKQIDSLLKDIDIFVKGTENINEKECNRFIGQRTGLDMVRGAYKNEYDAKNKTAFVKSIEKLEKDRDTLEKIKNAFGIK